MKLKARWRTFLLKTPLKPLIYIVTFPALIIIMLLEHLRESLLKFLLDPKNRPFLAVVKGLRNGLVYGTKIRFSHAAVMAMLFKTGSVRDKMHWVFMATKTHAKNLGLYVTIYKTAMLLLSILGQGKETSADPFIAGLLGGYIVFRRSNNINQQIVLYVFARNMLALAKLPIHKNLLPAKERIHDVAVQILS
ncbi:Peroxisomal membrane protein 4 [Neolecta irregularis DAH-3]|uniref:Peroxisomal membrane protein 4 n=1 Tax=Neolecta irregularis (strain DAH-3) TaxID=1198029 RepID=A0A1U7LV12_NEOID|nr:Peroxisomal membrane protein 4 [Neolecta irregularis DAH-3]|eukprot:OLL26497.1 Peroxisomal membrane protein 4 [Neolecta irregularis DAH-3]